MKIIRHRVNTLDALQTLEPGWGAELDLRSRGDEIIVNHDPFSDGESFEEWLGLWADDRVRGTLILNPKEDGIEGAALEMLKKHKVEDFFFLDLSLPTLVRVTMKENLSRVAVRVSEYESVKAALRFKGKAEWAWLDCFSGAPPEAKVITALQENFRLCLVSPELQAYDPDTIVAFLPLAREVDAICTKFPERWLND